MSLYTEELDKITEAYHAGLKIVAENKTKIELLETIIQSLEFNNIKATEMVSVYNFRLSKNNNVGLFIFPIDPSDDDVVKLLNIICTLVAAKPDAIAIDDNVGSCHYGYSISGADDIKITVGLQQYAKTFPLPYLQHLRSICQNTVPAVFFVG